jgi:serine/threonine protein kinase
VKKIGSGGFSEVFLCKSKNNGQFYAMKIIDKDMVVRNKKKKIVMN